MTSLSSCEWRSGQLGSPSWCNPWDQDTEESPSVTTTLFASYLRILLYNKFDVAKPSDHITTIKLIPPSYSGGPSLSVSVTANKQSVDSTWGETFLLQFLTNTVDSSQCFCFPLVEDGAIVFCPCPDPIRVCWFLQRQGQWHSGQQWQLTTSKHKSSGSGRQSLVWFSTIKP